MADILSSLRTNPRKNPFEDLTTAGQISHAEQYALNPEGEFSKGLRSGAAGLTAGSFASEALSREASGDASYIDPRDRALETAQEAQMYAPRVSSLRDIDSLSSAADYAAGAFGQGAMSMVPSIAAAALTRGRGPIGKATAFGGAMLPAYAMERGEAALSQYQDPELAQAPVEERALAAGVKGGINAALEAIVPAGLGGSLLRKPAGSVLGHVGRDALTEGLTETAQQAVGFGAEKYLDPNRKLDPWEMADAFAAGAITGGGMSGVTRTLPHAVKGGVEGIESVIPRRGEPGPEAVEGEIDPDAPPPPPEDMGERPGEATLDKAYELGQKAFDKAQSAGKEAFSKAKTTFEATIDRMDEASKTSTSAGEFIRKVFGNDLSDQAAGDLTETDPGSLKGATLEETEQNMARDEQSRAARAAQYAEALMSEPTMPESIKERIASMQGDYSDPADQRYLSRTLVAFRGGEKLRNAVDSAIAAAKSLSDKAVEGISDRIIKKNLQRVSDWEEHAFGKLIFDHMTDAAKADGYVRAQLASITNALTAFAAKTGDVTPEDLKAISKLSDVMTLFKNPDALIQDLEKYHHADSERGSFLSRIKNISSAQQDIKKPNSFLASSLTPEAAENMTTDELGKLAKIIDAYGHENMSREKNEAFINGLANVFGSPENARVVLDYYYKENKADTRLDIYEDGLSGPEQSMEETTLNEGTYRFKDSKTMQPYFNPDGEVDKMVEESASTPDMHFRKIPYSQYVKERGLDPNTELNRIMADVQRRGEARKAEAIRRPEGNHEPYIKALRNEWKMVEAIRKAHGASAALDLYSVLHADKDSDLLIASDADIQKYAANKYGDRIVFLKKNGKKLSLSAEAMWRAFGDKEQPLMMGGHEEITPRAQRLMKEAIASVLARDDIKELITDIRGIKLDSKGKIQLSKKRTEAEQEDVFRRLGSQEKQYIEAQKFFDNLIDKYLNIDSKDPDAGGLRYDIWDQLRHYTDKVDAYARKANSEGKKAIAERMIELGRSAKDRLKRIDQGYETEGDLVEEKEEPFRIRRETDTSDGPRYVEEDTGMAIGSSRAHTNWKLSRKPERKGGAESISDRVEAALSDVALKDNWDRLDTPERVIAFVKLAQKHLAAIKKDDNLEELADGLTRILAQRSKDVDLLALMRKLGASETQINELADLVPGVAEKLRREDQEAAEWSKDWDEYAEKTRKHLEAVDALLDIIVLGNWGRLDTPRKVYAFAKKAQQVFEELSSRHEDDLNSQEYGLLKELKKMLAPDGSFDWWGLSKKVGGTKDDLMDLRDILQIPVGEGDTPSVGGSTVPREVVDALYDVIKNENWGRLDAPRKVFAFAKKAKETLHALEGRKSGELSSKESFLRDRLEEMFDPLTQFSWESLMTEVEGTDGDVDRLRELVGVHKTYSRMRGGKDGGAIDKEAIMAEIARIRGKSVMVEFGKFLDIGGSGEYSISNGRTQRLIKIAVDSLNPMSVAWHESLHDFIAMLGHTKRERRIKEDLLDAAESPQVKVRLRELLKGHPEALKQVEKDREERLAYMYQFWAEGALKLGPTGTGLFQRMFRMFHRMLGVLTQDEKIEQLLEALHSGKFSEPSLVQYVLEDMKNDSLRDKVRAVSEPLGKISEKLFTSATDRLRHTEIPALGELADLFHREPDREKGGELPFMQRRAQQVGKFMNQLEKILEGSTAVDRYKAIQNLQSMKSPSSKLERELAGYLHKVYEYMVGSGVKRFDPEEKEWVPLGFVKNYFPRVWDKEIIRNNGGAFRRLLSNYVTAEQAARTYDAIVNGDGSLELTENKHSLGFTPWNPAVLNRQFTFINEENAADFAKYQVKDLADILTSYTQRAVHRAEYSRSFGNDGEVIAYKLKEAQDQGASREELEMAVKATMAMEGTLGFDMNPRLKEIMNGIMTYQNILLLPMSLFSNLIDPLGIAVRSNDMSEAWRAFKYGIKGLVEQIKGEGPDEATKMAKALGIVDEQNMLEAMGLTYNSMYMSKFMRGVNSKFFRYNGMEVWNQRVRVAAMGAAQRFIQRQAEVVRGSRFGRNQKAEARRYLRELGLTEKDVFVNEKDGSLAMTQEQLLEAGVSKRGVENLEKRVQAAVFKWVDGAVLRPNAAHRPIWGSDPRFQLIFHLKQFTYSFQNTILKRVRNELKSMNNAPAWILASYVPFMFASDLLRGSLTGTVQTSSDLYDVAMNSVVRSGVLGTKGFYEDVLEDANRGKLPGTSFAGPAFGHLMTLLSWLGGKIGMERLADRSVPLAKLVD